MDTTPGGRTRMMMIAECYEYATSVGISVFSDGYIVWWEE